MYARHTSLSLKIRRGSFLPSFRSSDTTHSYCKRTFNIVGRFTKQNANASAVLYITQIVN
nr:MAG TPA: hypothetical protein [Bacteriophage sp.]DAQ19738.1 MAG TPA: hypothetical protein [Caudoviricetes sp.]